MSCHQIENRLLTMTAAGPAPAFDDGDRAHLERCPACRALADAALAVRAAGGPTAGPSHDPDPRYWGTILPRLRARIADRESGPFGGRFAGLLPAARSAMMPAAAALVAVLAALALLRSPEETASTEASMLLGSLDEAELHDLGLSGSSLGLLEPAETPGAEGWTLAEVLTDLVSEEGDDALFAVAEPEELVPHLDDERFAQVVELLDRR